MDYEPEASDETAVLNAEPTREVDLSSSSSKVSCLYVCSIKHVGCWTKNHTEQHIAEQRSNIVSAGLYHHCMTYPLPPNDSDFYLVFLLHRWHLALRVANSSAICSYQLGHLHLMRSRKGDPMLWVWDHTTSMFSLNIYIQHKIPGLLVLSII